MKSVYRSPEGRQDIIGRDPSYVTGSANVQRSAGSGKVRVMLWGTPQFIAAMLECITAISGDNE